MGDLPFSHYLSGLGSVSSPGRASFEAAGAADVVV